MRGVSALLFDIRGKNKEAGTNKKAGSARELFVAPGGVVDEGGDDGCDLFEVGAKREKKRGRMYGRSYLYTCVSWEWTS
jgi:hypothetical protein